LNKPTHTQTVEIHVKGLIQGVGFRPFIYKLALEHKLRGFVHNQNNGVIIQIQGSSNQISLFKKEILLKAPKAADIDNIEYKIVSSPQYKDFKITESKKTGNSITRVSPDIAVCKECLSDLKYQEHRLEYPFINCTHCGPRFSIIENIPYDRSLTSMKDFEMCEKCREEYTNIVDRRFHAQPVACNHCGPIYTLHQPNKVTKEINEILSSTKSILEEGGILAIKGLGGFHLACDAFNEQAIQKLRAVKERDGKPFALMFKNMEQVKKVAEVNPDEEELLQSWMCPIVLLKSKTSLPEGIADKLDTLGVFLPYMPFHHQLFNATETPALVMTSGNIAHCPIITSNTVALDSFLDKTDGVITHNRSIVNRVDDSVVQVVNGQAQILRRSRGYVPSPLELNLPTEGIFAVGAELANTFCLGKGNEAIVSQHIGDLKNLETSSFYEEAFNRFKNLFDFTPKHVVCDMHPDYLSTRYAQSLNLPIIEVQHHHAHIAACMAEYGLDEPVIGITFDGTGYGTDGKTWGSEIMVADLENFERKYHFDYIPIPGGDRVSEQPWRSAVAYLHKYFGEIPEGLDFIRTIPASELSLVQQALKKNINCPESCSAGRLFDAVSALINVCTKATYHAEAPILLENAIGSTTKDHYPIELQESISFHDTISSIIHDLQTRTSVGEISARFHNTIIHIMLEAIKKIHAETGITTVVLSGGTFQNTYISKKALDLLQLTGLKGYMSCRIPVNDGGLSLGQLALAAKKLTLCV